MTIGFEFSTIITLIFSIIVVIIIGLYINWKLTLIMICLIPFVVVTMRLFSQVFDQPFMQFSVYLYIFESLKIMRQPKHLWHIRKQTKSSTKCLVHCALFFRLMVHDSNRGGKC